jgi:DNA-binding transcriptional LysR family regulator
VDEEFVFIFACGQDALPLELTPEVLQALPLIAFEAGSGTRELIDGWFRQRAGYFAGDAAGQH